jgi:uncharacterized protein
MSTALVTGGNTGLGAAFARRLAADGHDLVLVARDKARLDQVAAELRAAHHVDVEVMAADLTETTERAAVESRLDGTTGGEIELLVNNAGVNSGSAFEDTAPAAMQNEIDLNVTATLQLSRAALPGMRSRGHGAIINVSSFAGYLSGPGSVYGASKAWILAFTDTVAASLAGSGVQAIALCAGRMRTGRHPAGIDRSVTGRLMWLDPDDVVDRCLADLRKGKALSVPGLLYRTAVDVLELPRRSMRAAARIVGVGREQKQRAAAPCRRS